MHEAVVVQFACWGFCLFVADICPFSAFCFGRAVPLFVIPCRFLFACYVTAALMRKDGLAIITSRVVSGVFCFLNWSTYFLCKFLFVFQIRIHLASGEIR